MSFSAFKALEQKFMLAFEGFIPPPKIQEILARSNISGFTIFRGLNFDDTGQMRDLTRSLQKAAAQAGHLPLLIAADQEGGQLNALAGNATLFAGNMALGAARDPGLAEQVGYAQGQELAAMGINVNYAPVCDINTNPDNPALGIRAVSDDPALAGRIAAALVKGMQKAGVAATLKHFPGSGEAAVDTHYEMPVINHGRERLESLELVPFQHGIDAGAKLVMSGHFAIPALAGTSEYPATLSRRVMRDYLRSHMGFKGVVITDALDMGAITQGAGQLVDVVTAIRAEVDLMLLTNDPDARTRLMTGVEQAYSRGLIKKKHLKSSAERTAALRRWAALDNQPGLEVIGSKAHRLLAKEVAEKALTVVRDEAGLLPLSLPAGARILAVMPRPKNLTPADTSAQVKPGLARALRQHHDQVTEIVTSYPPASDEIAAVKEQAASHDLVIAATITAHLDPQQAALVNELLASGKPVITVALRTPYDITSYPKARTHIVTYSILPESMDALAAGLWGQLPFPGQLPVHFNQE